MAKIVDTLSVPASATLADVAVIDREIDKCDRAMARAALALTVQNVVRVQTLAAVPGSGDAIAKDMKAAGMPRASAPTVNKDRVIGDLFRLPYDVETATDPLFGLPVVEVQRGEEIVEMQITPEMVARWIGNASAGYLPVESARRIVASGTDRTETAVALWAAYLTAREEFDTVLTALKDARSRVAKAVKDAESKGWSDEARAELESLRADIAGITLVPNLKVA